MRPHQSPRLSRDIEASKVHMSLKMDVIIAGIRTLDLAHASRALCLSPNPKRVIRPLLSAIGCSFWAHSANHVEEDVRMLHQI